MICLPNQTKKMKIIQQIQQLEKNSIKIMCNESVRDSLVDLRNYATLALIEMDNVNEIE